MKNKLKYLILAAFLLIQVTPLTAGCWCDDKTNAREDVEDVAEDVEDKAKDAKDYVADKASDIKDKIQ